LHGDSLTRLSEGTAVIVSLDPVTIHVIATGSSR
jgi:hypothetical protein